eukprot:334061-Amphidinium_carterae.1
MGGTDKTVVVKLATEAEKSEYYMSKIEAYLHDVQGVLQYGGTIEEYLAQLNDMQLSIESCH